MTTRSTFRFGLVAMIAALTACGGAPAGKPPAEQTRFEFEPDKLLMGTAFRIVAYGDDEAKARAAADEAFARIDQLNRVLSDYDRASELSRLSDTAGSGQWVKVSDDLWKVMRASHELSVKSDGAFDITVGPVVQLWRWAQRNRQMPSAERLSAAVAAVGYQKIEYDEAKRAVKLTAPGMRLDVGAIGKGYACAEAMKILKARRFTSAMVHCDSSTVVSDAPPGKKGWRIGVGMLNPREEAPEKYVVLANGGVCTSGDAERFVELDGVRYSHIVDPKTGIGVSERSTVTVVTPDGVLPDGISTAITVMGPDKGLEFVEKIDGAAAFIVRKHGDHVEVYESKRVKQLNIEGPKR